MDRLIDPVMHRCSIEGSTYAVYGWIHFGVFGQSGWQSGGYFGVIFVSLGSLWASKLPLRSPRDGISNKIRNWWKKLDCGASVLGVLCRQNAIF